METNKKVNDNISVKHWDNIEWNLGFQTWCKKYSNKWKWLPNKKLVNYSLNSHKNMEMKLNAINQSIKKLKC